MLTIHPSGAGIWACRLLRQAVVSHSPTSKDSPTSQAVGRGRSSPSRSRSPSDWRRRRAHGAEADTAGSSAPFLLMLVECCEPLFFEIAGFLVEAPSDIARCEAVAPCLEQCLETVVPELWARMYKRRWPTFGECLQFRERGVTDWRFLYKETLSGLIECTLEVFDRERSLGFAMAAMPARMRYDPKQDSYVAKYISASDVPMEVIPVSQEYRLRHCPASACDQLQPGRPLAGSALLAGRRRGSPKRSWPCPDVYPYRVLEGTEGLVEGEGVELQWRMQQRSPFGWWYGHLESLRRHGDGRLLAVATITFRHFPSNSAWYRLDVVFGDSEMRPCPFGGFTGGIRPVLEEREKMQWNRFFPARPIPA